MKTLMRNGRDRRSENPGSATRGKNACFWLGPISGSHQGQQPQRLHLKAGYMAAPVSFCEKVRFFSLAPRAPSLQNRKRIVHRSNRDDVDLRGARGTILVPTATTENVRLAS